MASVLPLVGRQTELAQLREHLTRAAAGSGCLVMLGGEAGIGKTALLQVLLAEAAVAAVGRCPGADETPPFGPWLEALDDLSRATHRELSDLPPPFGSGSDGTPAQLAVAVADWLGHASRPLAVVLEDLHWADPASLDLLRQMALRAERTPALLIATYRADEVSRHHPLWTLLPGLVRLGAERMQLGPLPPAAVQELAEAVLSGPAAPRAGDLLHRRTGGHPLFLRELLDAAVRAGAVPAEDAPLPETVQQAIDVKLAPLAPDTLAVLQAAAVLGERFAYDLLAQVAGRPEEDLAACLDEAVSLHVLHATSPAGDQFGFTHALVREALLGRLPLVHRRRWHACAAEALLRAPRPDLDSLALHLRLAADPRAVDYLLAAGDRAKRLSAVQHAGQLYRQALDLVPDGDPRRGELLLKLGHSLRWVPESGEQDYYREAVAAAEAAGDAAVAAWARHILLEQRFHKERDPLCLPEIEQEESRQRELLADPRYRKVKADLYGDPNVRLPPAMLLRLNGLVLQGRFDAVRAAVAAAEAELASEQEPILIGLRELLAIVDGRWDEYLALNRWAADYFRQHHNYLGALGAESNCLWALLHCAADDPDALDAALAWVEQADALGSEPEWAGPFGAAMARGWVQFLRGDWDGARQNLLDRLGRHPDFYSAHVRGMACRMHLALGDVAGARAALSGLKPSRPQAEPGLESGVSGIFTQCNHVRLCLAEGDLPQARAWAAAAVRWWELRPVRGLAAHPPLAAALVFRRSGDAPAARREAGRALELGRETNDCPAVISARRLLGELAAEAGNAAEAEAHFQGALGLSQRCRFAYETARTQVAQARALGAAPGAAEGLAAARETLARLGAGPALAAAEELLAGTPAAPGVAAQPASALPDGLTEREAEIIRLVARGLTDREVGAQLYISHRTVDAHLRNIFNKVGVSSRAALAAYAARRGLDE